jgi:hypothetical protein
MTLKFDIFSLIIVVASLVILGLAGMVIGNFASEFGEEIQDTSDDVLVGSEYVNVSANFMVEDSNNFADNYFFWFLVATFIGVILMGLYLEFEPTTMIIIFVIGTIVVAGAWLGASIYEGVAEDVDTSGEMSKTNVLLSSTYFPIFIFITLLVLVVIMYNRKRAGDFQ